MEKKFFDGGMVCCVSCTVHLLNSPQKCTLMKSGSVIKIYVTGGMATIIIDYVVCIDFYQI